MLGVAVRVRENALLVSAMALYYHSGDHSRYFSAGCFFFFGWTVKTRASAPPFFKTAARGVWETAREPQRAFLSSSFFFSRGDLRGAGDRSPQPRGTAARGIKMRASDARRLSRLVQKKMCPVRDERRERKNSRRSPSFAPELKTIARGGASFETTPRPALGPPETRPSRTPPNALTLTHSLFSPQPVPENTYVRHLVRKLARRTFFF